MGAMNFISAFMKFTSYVFMKIISRPMKIISIEVLPNHISFREHHIDRGLSRLVSMRLHHL